MILVFCCCTRNLNFCWCTIKKTDITQFYHDANVPKNIERFFVIFIGGSLKNFTDKLVKTPLFDNKLSLLYFRTQFCANFMRFRRKYLKIPMKIRKSQTTTTTIRLYKKILSQARDMTINKILRKRK